MAAAPRHLVHYLPAQRVTIIDPAYVQSLGTIPDGQAKEDGSRLGEQVAEDLIALRADDGFRAPVPTRRRIRRSPASGSRPRSRRRSAPTCSTCALQPRLRRASSGPRAPPLSSRRWARDYNEVQGDRLATSTTRTANRRWRLASGVSPPSSRHMPFRKFVVDHALDVAEPRDSWRWLGRLRRRDIACFEAKYTTRSGGRSPRSGPAIRTATTPRSPIRTGAPASGDSEPPEYPSAHSCATTASRA